MIYLLALGPLTMQFPRAAGLLLASQYAVDFTKEQQLVSPCGAHAV